MGSKGNLVKKNMTVKAMAPKKPAVIATSVMPIGKPFPSQRDGTIRRNRSNHIPISMTVAKTIMATGAILILRLNRATKGTAKQTTRMIHARGSHGLWRTRKMTYWASSGRLPYQMTRN